MEKIGNKFLICSIFVLMVSQNEGVSIIPQFPAEISLQPFTHNSSESLDGTFTDISYSQAGTTVFGLEDLKDELSYNCASNNFELALVIPSTLHFAADYKMEAYISSIIGLFDIRDVVGNLEFSQSAGEKLVTMTGKIVTKNQDEDSALELQIAKLNWTSYPIVATVDAGTWNDVPLEEYFGENLEALIIVIRALVSQGSLASTQTIIQDYLNKNVLNSTSLTDLIGVVAGSCPVGNGIQGSLFPDLPEEIRLEPVVYSLNDSIRQVVVNYERIFSGLTDLQNELSYNCLTGNTEFSLRGHTFAIGGLFNLTGTLAYNPPMELRGEGHVKENCPKEGVKPDGSCLLIFTGIIQDQGSYVSIKNFIMTNSLELEFIIEDGTVDGEGLTEENVRYIRAQLDELAPNLRRDFSPIVMDHVNAQLMNVTMTQLIQLTGGSVNCLNK